MVRDMLLSLSRRSLLLPSLHCIRILYTVSPCTPGYLTHPWLAGRTVYPLKFCSLYYRIHFVIYHFPLPPSCFDDTMCPPVPGRPRGCSSNDATSFCPFISS